MEAICEKTSLPNEAHIAFFDKTGNGLSQTATPSKVKIPAGCSYMEINQEL